VASAMRHTFERRSHPRNSSALTSSLVFIAWHYNIESRGKPRLVVKLLIIDIECEKRAETDANVSGFTVSTSKLRDLEKMK